MSADMKIAVTGAGGRMGRTLLALIHATPGAVVAGGIEAKGSPHIGTDLGTLAGLAEPIGMAASDDALSIIKDADALIDFSVPAASVEFAGLAAQARIVHVIGTTGLSEEDETRISAAARHATIIKAGNMSLGVNLLASLVRQAARALDPSWDIEVVEMHHRHKVDAPSGTALRMGEVVAQTLGRDLNQCAVYGREGRTGERDRRTIGFETIRAGDIVGEHTVLFAADGERVEITHKASSRMSFARGAVRAAVWLAEQPKGLFDMQDVLGLK